MGREKESISDGMYTYMCIYISLLGHSSKLIQLDQTALCTPPLGSKLGPDCIKICVYRIKQCPDALILLTAGGNESNGVISELHTGVFH